MICSDRRGEYIEPFGEYCSQRGIINEVTAPYSPRSNGVDEQEESHSQRDDECDVLKL